MKTKHRSHTATRLFSTSPQALPLLGNTRELYRNAWFTFDRPFALTARVTC